MHHEHILSINLCCGSPVAMEPFLQHVLGIVIHEVDDVIKPQQHCLHACPVAEVDWLSGADRVARLIEVRVSNGELQPGLPFEHSLPFTATPPTVGQIFLASLYDPIQSTVD